VPAAEPARFGAPCPSDFAIAILVAWARCLTEPELPIELSDPRIDALRERARADAQAPGSFVAFRPVFGALGEDERLLEAYRAQHAALQLGGVKSMLVPLG
jgi:hypothetical protein